MAPTAAACIRPTGMADLPPEILLHILLFCDLHALRALMRVSSLLRALAHVAACSRGRRLAKEWDEWCRTLEGRRPRCRAFAHRYSIQVKNTCTHAVALDISIPEAVHKVEVDIGMRGVHFPPLTQTTLLIPDFQWLCWGGPFRVTRHLGGKAVYIALSHVLPRLSTFAGRKVVQVLPFDCLIIAEEGGQEIIRYAGNAEREDLEGITTIDALWTRNVADVAQPDVQPHFLADQLLGYPLPPRTASRNLLHTYCHKALLHLESRVGLLAADIVLDPDSADHGIFGYPVFGGLNSIPIPALAKSSPNREVAELASYYPHLNEMNCDDTNGACPSLPSQSSFPHGHGARTTPIPLPARCQNAGDSYGNGSDHSPDMHTDFALSSSLPSRHPVPFSAACGAVDDMPEVPVVPSALHLRFQAIARLHPTPNSDAAPPTAATEATPCQHYKDWLAALPWVCMSVGDRVRVDKHGVTVTESITGACKVAFKYES